MGICKDLTGQKFGRLTVIERVGSNKYKKALWRCVCECGCGNEVITTTSQLKSGSTKSCGCYNRDMAIQTNKKYNIYDLSNDYGIGYAHNNNKPFYFDLEDYDKIKDYCWSECNGYLETKIGFTNPNVSLRFHRLVTDCPDNMVVDHINHNTLDNRKENLRICTVSQNGMNQKLSSRNKSGVKGVSFHTKSHKWRATITVNKKQIELGEFDDIQDAINARKEAEIKYFDEYRYKGDN